MTSKAPRDVRPPSRRQIVATAATLLALLGFCLFVTAWFFCGHLVEAWIHRRPFDAQAWRSQSQRARDGDWPPRLCMVDDLLLSGRLIGMTEAEVIDLLGSPDRKSHPLLYVLGPERGWSRIDSESLMIDFGRDGKVRGACLYRD